MTGRERLLAALGAAPADRVGWAPELNDYYFRARLAEAGREPPPDCPDKNAWRYAECAEMIGADCLWSHFPYRVDFRGTEEVVTKDAEGVTTRVLKTPKGELVERSRYDDTARSTFRLEHLLKTPEDFVRYRAHLDAAEVTADYESFRRAEEAVGARGIVSVHVPETPIMGLIMYHMGIEETLFACFDHAAEIRELFDAVHAFNMECYRVACAPGAPGEMVRPFEDTSSSLTSPDMFDELCAPYLSDYGEASRAGGKQFVPHCCGTLAAMLPRMKALPIDGIEAATPPPTGDAPATMLREVMGPDCLILGGFDPTRSAISSPAEVSEMVGRVLEEMRGDARFVLAHEEISPAAKPECVEAMARQVAASAIDGKDIAG